LFRDVLDPLAALQYGLTSEPAGPDSDALGAGNPLRRLRQRFRPPQEDDVFTAFTQPTRRSGADAVVLSAAIG
jgi:hypothetical protein